MIQLPIVRVGLASIITILLSQCSGGTPAVPEPSAAAPSSAPSTAPSASPSTAPSAVPSVAVTPTRQQAYEQLLRSIPAQIAAYCEPFPESVALEPGQIGQADCDLPDDSIGDFVSYELFADRASLDTFFDTQRKGHENLGNASGPGCGKGAGEGTWEHGRKDCFTFFDDAYVMWTYDDLLIDATALQNGGDFAKLEAFWKVAGPVAP